MYYGPEVIIENGITLGDDYDREQTGILLNIPLSATNAVGTMISVFFIDSLGRRWLMLRSLPIIFIS